MRKIRGTIDAASAVCLGALSGAVSGAALVDATPRSRAAPGSSRRQGWALVSTV